MPPLRFHIAVDDGGEYFAASGESLTIGHLRSPSADLPFLADVELAHARLVLFQSFHEGPSWSIGRAGAASVRVEGFEIGAEARRLAHGETVELAGNLAFRFRAPDPASASAVLDLLSGAECEGARHVLLLAPDAAGRVRIGRGESRHVQVQDLVHDVSLELSGTDLAVRCAGGVRVSGFASPPGAESGLSIPCPPPQLLALSLGARGAGKPPFGITVWPATSDAALRRS